METLIELFGEGPELNVYQMTLRGIVIFMIALTLIRLAGHRSFGMHMPLDNVITILLGAILSRAVVGSSPFFSVVISCAVIAFVHRICSTFAFYNKLFGRMVKGEELILYANRKLNEENMKRCMISRDDLIEGVRLNANVASLEETECVYMERTGQISVIKKRQA